MRYLSALSVDATFDTTPPDLSRIPGVTAMEVAGNRVRCQVVGWVEPLLGVPAASEVHQLLSREPSLEELFLAHYGRGPAEPGGAACGVRPAPPTGEPAAAPAWPRSSARPGGWVAWRTFGLLVIVGTQGRRQGRPQRGDASPALAPLPDRKES